MHAAARENEAVPFLPPPPTATWQHQDAQTGFEVVHFTPTDDGHHIVGCTAAEEDGRAWVVWYEIDVTADWVTQRATVTNRTVDGERMVALESVADGHWLVDGTPAPHLDGCFDVDLESSAMTNAFPVHRLALDVGEESPAPAAYVRADDLSVERLEQTYERLPDEDERQRFHYESPAFEFECTLEYDESGLVTSYPGIAARFS